MEEELTRRPLDPNAFHLALYLFVNEYPDLKALVPTRFQESEFKERYNKFCKEFRKRMPHCLESEFYGFYDDVYVNKTECPRCESELMKLVTYCRSRERLEKHRLKNGVFIFDDDFTRFGVDFGFARQDRSYITDSSGPLSYREGDNVFSTFIIFYGLENWWVYVNDIKNSEVGPVLVEAIKAAMPELQTLN